MGRVTLAVRLSVCVLVGMRAFKCPRVALLEIAVMVINGEIPYQEDETNVTLIPPRFFLVPFDILHE